MIKRLDKFKINIDRNLFLFFTILTLIAISTGSIFVTILNETDKQLISIHITQFIDNINSLNTLIALKNNMISILIFIIVIWLLGISAVGLPFIIAIFFYKVFITGFTIGSIFYTYGAKGITFALATLFPGSIITILSLLILSMYAITFSLNLIHCIIKRKTIDFSKMMNKYFKILFITSIICITTTLYDSLILPILLSKIITFMI